jgi:hypothetical protein
MSFDAPYIDNDGDNLDDNSKLPYIQHERQRASQGGSGAGAFPTDGRTVLLSPPQSNTNMRGGPAARRNGSLIPQTPVNVSDAKSKFRGGLIAGDPATQSIATWMFNSGLISKDPTTLAGIDQASKVYNQAVDYTADANAFGDSTKNVMDMLSQGYGGGTTTGSGAGGTSTYKQYTSFTKEQARKKATDAYRAVLGRSPSEQEIAEFANGLMSATKAAPSVQKTTTKGKSTSQTTTAGFNEKDWTLGFLSSKIPAEGDLLGASGSAQDMITAFSQDYGIKLSSALAFDTVRDVIQGKIDQTGVEQMFKEQAKILFPHLSEKIDAGLSPRKIADAYIGNTTKILEKGITEVDMFNPYVKEAMNQKDAQGNYVLPTADEHARMLRSKDEWLDTRNGKETLMKAADNILKTMGFE